MTESQNIDSDQAPGYSFEFHPGFFENFKSYRAKKIENIQGSFLFTNIQKQVMIQNIDSKIQEAVKQGRQEAVLISSGASEGSAKTSEKPPTTVDEIFSSKDLSLEQKINTMMTFEPKKGESVPNKI